MVSEITHFTSEAAVGPVLEAREVGNGAGRGDADEIETGGGGEFVNEARTERVCQHLHFFATSITVAARLGIINRTFTRRRRQTRARAANSCADLTCSRVRVSRAH